MYAFFLKHSGIDAPTDEPPLEEVTEQELWALPTGNTADAGSRRVFDFTRDAGAALKPIDTGPNRQTVTDAVYKLLSIPPTAGTPHFRCLHHYNGVKEDPPWLSQFAVESEPGIQVILTTYGSGLRKMHLPTGPVLVYVGHADAQEDLRTNSYARQLLDEPQPLVAVEPRGFGITTATTSNSTDFFFSHGSDGLYGAIGEILGESYLGRRVYDLLRALDCLMANGSTSIRLIGRGVGSVIVAFAGALHPSSPSVHLQDYLPTYRTLLEDPLACWPLSSLAYGALHEVDLPNVYHMLEHESRLELGRPWDARMRPA
jgi:hypothetical protein